MKENEQHMTKPTIRPVQSAKIRPMQPSNMARVFVYPSLDSLEAVEGTCDWRRL